MQQRRFGTIDLDTGEVLEEGVAVWVGRKVRVTERWFMAFQDALIELSKDRDLTGENWRVLVHLFGRLDFENFIQIKQSEIADELGMAKTHVSRSIKALVDKQIIFRGPKIGRSSSFRLNPHFGWKGKVSSLREAQRSHLELVSNKSEKSDSLVPD